jgi:hypothetical protein
MARTIRIRIKADPERSKAKTWKAHKMGLLTHKGLKISRSVRNRTYQEELCQND